MINYLSPLTSGFYKYGSGSRLSDISKSMRIKKYFDADWSENIINAVHSEAKDDNQHSS